MRQTNQPVLGAGCSFCMFFFFGVGVASPGSCIKIYAAFGFGVGLYERRQGSVRARDCCGLGPPRRVVSSNKWVLLGRMAKMGNGTLF